MKKKAKIIALLLVTALTIVSVAGCGSSKSANKESTKKNIKIGVRSDLVGMYKVVKPVLEKKGYKVTMKSFDDSVQPDQALKEGSIYINWYQHEPYMKSYNKENKTNFVMVKPKTYAPLFAMYSTKYKKVSQIPDGATIGLCNDATNQDRGLRLLQKEKLIKLNPSVKVATIHDIKSNPKHLKFKEAEMSVLPQSIDDVDAICLAGLHMVNAGKDANNYIAKSNDDKEYAVGFVVNKKDQNAKWAKDIAKAVQCKELADYLKKDSKGALLPMWDTSK